MLTKQFAFDLDAKSLGDSGTFEGLASVYGNVDDGGDIVEPGAFTKSIANQSSVPILYQHNQKQPIGLGRLEDTASGLKIYGELVLDVPEAKSAYALMRKGVLKGLSIGYQTVKEAFDSQTKANRLKEVTLHEVSVVTFPMNRLATIQGVKAIEDINTIRDFEEYLRDSGLPKAAAVALVAKAKQVVRRDADDTDKEPADVNAIAALLAARTQNLRRLTWN